MTVALAAVMTVAFDRFSIDEAVVDGIIRIAGGGGNTKGEFRQVLWAMHHHDHADDVSRSHRSLA